MTDEANRLRQLAAARRKAAETMPPHSVMREVALTTAAQMEAQASALERRNSLEPRDFNDDTAARAGHDRRTKRGTREKARALTEADVAEIIKHTAAGARHAEIGKRFRVHPDTISRIARGETWAHVCPGQDRGRSRWRGHNRAAWRDLE